jgi:hypothetical protein
MIANPHHRTQGLISRREESLRFNISFYRLEKSLPIRHAEQRSARFG